MKHGGTGTGYSYHGCRCQECRAAATARFRAWRQQYDGPPPNAPHGTRSTYSNYGCRCEPCRAAQSIYLRRRRSRAKVGAP